MKPEGRSRFTARCAATKLFTGARDGLIQRAQHVPGEQVRIPYIGRWRCSIILFPILITLLAGCGDGPGNHVVTSDVGGVSPSGQKYSGMKLIRRDGDFESFVIVITTPDWAITSMANTGTAVQVRLNKTNMLEATWGKSIAVTGSRSQTIRNEADAKTTQAKLEEALENLLPIAHQVPDSPRNVENAGGEGRGR